MQIEINANGMSVDDTLHEHALDRLAYGLSSYDNQIHFITVTFSELENHTGIDGKVCHLQVNSEQIKELVVEENASDFYIAIDKASEKIRRIMLGKMFLRNFYARENYAYSESQA